MKHLILTGTLLAFSTALMAHASPTPKDDSKIPEKIMTPDRVSTSIGELKFYDGMPLEETRSKVFDHLDFLRGVETFLTYIPAASIEAMRLGLKDLGVDDYNKVVVFDQLMDSKPLFLTGNTDTVYASAVLDLEKNGPTIVEIPPNAGPGTLNDAFFRFVVDMGAPGPDHKKGGTYLILPPDYKGELKPTDNGMEITTKKDTRVSIDVAGKPTKVWIAQSRSYTNWLILRGFLVDGKPDAASKMWRTGLKIYPLKDATNPKKMVYINASKKSFNTIHANNFEFFEELHSVLQKEPVDFIDPEIRGLASAIGIAKDKPFAPDQRMKKILTDAVAVGNATARSISLRPRDPNAYLYKGKQWYTGFVGGDYRWLDHHGKNGRNLDARTLFFYSATVNTPAMALEIPGVGSNYAFATTDKNGQILYGEKNYKLTIPAKVPAKDFWSVVVYDPQTRSELQTSQPYPSKNNTRDKLIYNEDGSVTLYYGPKAPAGKEANWTQTVPGKAWFVLFRTYGPLQPWFDKSWQLNDFEEIK